MRGELDRALDAGLQAGRSWRMSLDESLSGWPRLADAATGAPGRIRGSIDFDLRGDGSALLDAELELDLGLVCQRCLREIRLAIPLRVRMALGEETGAPEGYEAYGQVAGATVRQLLEDEMLLEVPGFPVHPSAADCGPMDEMIERLAPEETGAERGENPFAALASLKKPK